MKNNKIFTFILPFFILGCSFNINKENNLDVKNSQITSSKNKAKWTVMAYISGDNNLEKYVVKDLETELAFPGSTENVQVVALADRTPGYDSSRGDWTSTKLFHVTKDMKATPESAVADWGERNFGDKQTLIDFVSWSKKNYPADHYALFMWGHGWSWHQGFTMEDKTNNDSLDPDEVKQSFDSLGQIDMIAYDGCNMASIEVDALWHNHASAIVHSQEYVGWDGIEYDIVLKKLNENPNMNADQLAIVTNQSASLNKEKTGSAIALDSRFDKLLQALDDWSISLKKGLEKNRLNYDKAFKSVQHFWDAPEDKDLYDMAYKVNQYVSDPEIKLKGDILMNAIKAVTLNEWHVKDYPNAHGITISKVTAKDENKNYYRTLDLSKKTHWVQFLDEYKN